MHDDLGSNDFNTEDITTADYAARELGKLGVRNFKAFLGTPSGRYRVYDPTTKRTGNLSRDNGGNKPKAEKSGEFFDLGGMITGNRAQGTRIGCDRENGENVC
jgi:hypothetical protein